MPVSVLVLVQLSSVYYACGVLCLKEHRSKGHVFIGFEQHTEALLFFACLSTYTEPLVLFLICVCVCVSGFTKLRVSRGTSL